MNEVVELFEVEGGKLVPTKHCYALSFLKNIMDEYNKDSEYLEIYKYIFYMTCPYPKKNPFFNLPEHEKEAAILAAMNIKVSLDDSLIEVAKKECLKLYDSRGVRVYKSMALAVENISKYMQEAIPTDGRDGNLNALIKAIEHYPKMRESFEKAENAFIATLIGKKVRGEEDTAYDQNANKR